ncbi:SLG1 Protein SLG1 [Candida maltosa Xu316]
MVLGAQYFAPASNMGCYSALPNGKSQGNYMFQSSGYCSNLCRSSNYFAIKGEECICLDTFPSNSNKLSNSSCNTPCPGYSEESCGGNNAYDIFKGFADKSATSSSASGASSGTSSSSDPSETSSNDDSSSSSSSDGGDDDNKTETIVSTISQDNGSVIYTTITQNASQTSGSSTTGGSSSSSSTSTSTSSSSSKSQNKSSSSTPVGTIVGGVIGGVAGLAIIVVGLFFCWRSKSEDDDDEEEFFDKPVGRAPIGSKTGSRRGQPSPLDMPMTNPFQHPEDDLVRNNSMQKNGFVDPRLNPIMMGRRRLSEGSLADEADYSRKVLQIANPDNR